MGTNLIDWSITGQSVFEHIHILASTEWIYIKFYARNIYYKRVNWFNFGVFISRGSAAAQFFFFFFLFPRGCPIIFWMEFTILNAWDTNNTNFCWINDKEWRNCTISIDRVDLYLRNPCNKYNKFFFFFLSKLRLYIKNR